VVDVAKTTLSGPELLLLALFIASILIAIWGYNAVWKEGEKVAPLQFRENATFHIWLDQFIWSAAASRKVRRQYVITTGWVVLGMACLTALAWGRHDHHAIVASLMLVVVTSTFGWRCLRHWRDIRSEE
jgi:phosphate/sulfate permease